MDGISHIPRFEDEVEVDLHFFTLSDPIGPSARNEWVRKNQVNPLIDGR